MAEYDNHGNTTLEVGDEPILHFLTLDSTNLYCLREADKLASGTVVVADSQTAGRGRQGRQWQSPPGRNLYASILLKPPFMHADVALFPQVTALAIHAALRDLGLTEAWIKWPNDLFVGDQKLAGILCENQYRANQVQAVVVGLGVNLNMSAEELAKIDRPATSVLAETGKWVERGVFLQGLLSQFRRCLQRAQQFGFAELYPEWRAASRLVGRQVWMISPRETQAGEVADLEADGALLLRLPDGTQRRYYAGEVSLRW